MSPTYENSLEILYEQCVKNVSQFPIIADTLSQQLKNVSVDSLFQIGVGYHPIKGAYVFPERGPKNKIVGLAYRSVQNGKKWMEEGSQRGLIYPVGSTTYRKIDNRIIEIDGTPYWRLYEKDGIKCPICEHTDWCLIEAADKENPSKVICPRTEEGSVRTYGAAGHLHIRHGEKPKKQHSGALPPSDDPVLICEGASDCLTALSMGFVAVGKPAANLTPSTLIPLVKGRDIIIIGDNGKDGLRGAKETYQILKSKDRNRTVTLVFPPKEYPDLRAWGCSHEEFLTYVKEYSTTIDDSETEEFIDYSTSAKNFLLDRYEKDNQRTLHFFLSSDPNDKGTWYKYNSCCYDKYNPRSFDAEFLDYFNGLTINKIRGSISRIEPVRINGKFLDEIRRMLRAHCELKIPDGIRMPFSIKHLIRLPLDKHVIFANGALDIFTGKLESLNPDVFIDSTLPYDYDPCATYSEWWAFINEIFEGDDERINLLQEWLGYNLIISDFLESLMILYGVRNSGKGTVQKVMQAILGKRRYEAAKINSFTSNFGLSPFIRKYSLFISEHAPATHADGAKLLTAWKAITGRDDQSIDRKYESIITEELFCKITYSCNELPVFNDPSLAFDRRVNLLWFGIDFTKTGTLDPTLKDRLVKEAPGITIWALEGLQRLLKNEKFTQPKACEEAREELRETLNPILMMKDYCIFEDENWASVKELFDVYYKLCEEGNSKALSIKWFGRKFNNAFPEIKRKRDRVGGEQMWGYTGVRLTKEAQRKYLGRP